MTTKIDATNIQAGAITQDLIANTVQLGGPKIANVQIANSSWSALDDTAVSLDGGYILINGAGFVSGASVLINNVPVTSAAVVNSSIIRAEVPSANAGTYVAYVVNPDGGTAIGVNALTYSATPTWVTGSTLSDQIIDTAISIQLEATGATSYSLAAGSSLPANTTLASNGLFSGTVTGIEVDTNYSFTVEAIDDENQESPRTFSVTVTTIVADEYFNSTVLLLQADGTSNTAQNQTILDSSTNATAISRYGNVTQGSFSPFSPTGWSNYFDGTGDYLEIANDAAFDFGTGDFTIEGLFNLEKDAAANPDGNRSAALLTCMFSTGVSSGWSIEVGGNSSTTGTGIGMALWNGGTSTTPISYSTTFSKGLWYHFAFVRSGNNFTLYLNGTSVATGTTAVNANSGGFPCRIGATQVGSAPKYYHYFPGNISNVRVVKGSAVYTSNFTPSTIPLIAVSGTSLLTCQSNRFVDNSTNNFAITKAGDAKVVSFSPFAPTEAYNPTTHGGSLYLDDSGDFMTVESGTPINFGTNNFTIEWWVQRVTAYTTDRDELPMGGDTTSSFMLGMQNGVLQFGITNTSWNIVSSITIPLEVWAHCAIVRSGTTVTMYINGVSAGSATMSTNFTGASYFQIGRRGASTVTNKSNNYLSGLRIVNGTAVYTSAFTPPTSAPTAIANTSLLVNATNAGIYDATAKNVLETVGNAQVRTSFKKYGTGSMYFDGTGDYLYQLTNSLYSFGTGDFTIEFWFNPLALDGDRLIVDMRVSGSDTLPAIYSTGTNIAYYTAGAQRIAAGTLSTSTWQHIALVRSSGSTKMYLNGTQVGSAYTDSNSYGSAPLRVGIGWNGSNPTYGYIDDLRITKGVARYTSNFTPPTSEFPKQ